MFLDFRLFLFFVSFFFFFFLFFFFFFVTLLTVTENGLHFLFLQKIAKDQTKLLYSVFTSRGFFVGLPYFPHPHLPFIRLWSGVFLFCFLFTRHFYQYCSITNLCATLANRCISIVKPLKSFALITRKRIIFLSVASLRRSTFAVCLKLDSKSTRILVISRNLHRESRVLNEVRFSYRSKTMGLKIVISEIFEIQEVTAKMMIALLVIFILCSPVEHNILERFALM